MHPTTAPVPAITGADAKNLLILLNRVPTVTPAEAEEFVALRAKLGAIAIADNPVVDENNPLAPPQPIDGPVVVGPAPPRRRAARKPAKRRS